MSTDDIRWHQRFQNLLKAFHLLQEAATVEDLSPLESEGLIRRFDYTFELSWKTLKNYLESKGFAVQFPRVRIKEAFRAGLLGDGVTRETAASLSRELNERLPIPHYIDVVAYRAIDHDGLKRHIDTEGREFFRRDAIPS